MHIVHTRQGLPDGESPLTADSGLAVTGFFFEISDEDNAALQPLVDSLVDIVASDSSVPMIDSAFKISDLITEVAGSSVWATYPGSLTTPTCNEVVHWIVFMTPLKISQAQLEKFRMLDDSHDENIVDNFRPVQPLNGRTVTFYS